MFPLDPKVGDILLKEVHLVKIEHLPHLFYRENGIFCQDILGRQFDSDIRLQTQTPDFRHRI